MEVVLATLESKLRPVENLDRAIQQLMRRVTAIDRKIDSHQKQRARLRAEAADRDARRYQALVQKLDYLAEKFDSVCEEDVQELEDIIALPSVR